MDVQEVIRRCRSVAKQRWGWMARCPVHEDRRRSLSIRVAERTNDILLKCHAGCSYDSILSAIGLKRTDCYGERGLPMGKEVAAYDYQDETGALLFQVVRFEPKDFRQRRPNGEWGLGSTRRVLYRLPALIQNVNRKVFLCEGEKDVDRLTKEGLLATCNPMGAGKWNDDYTMTLKNRVVIVIPDNDKAGRDHAENVYRHLVPAAQKVTLLTLPSAKDVSEWLDAGGTIEQLKELSTDALASTKVEPGDLKEVVRLARSLDRRSRWLAIRQLMADLETEE